MAYPSNILQKKLLCDLLDTITSQRTSEAVAIRSGSGQLPVCCMYVRAVRLVRADGSLCAMPTLQCKHFVHHLPRLVSGQQRSRGEGGIVRPLDGRSARHRALSSVFGIYSKHGLNVGSRASLKTRSSMILGTIQRLTFWRAMPTVRCLQAIWFKACRANGVRQGSRAFLRETLLAQNPGRIILHGVHVPPPPLGPFHVLCLQQSGRDHLCKAPHTAFGHVMLI